VLCLRVLQAALVYVNTLMVQDVLAGEHLAGTLTDADRRGLTPLSWTHVYGEVKPDMNSRLALGAPASAQG
jgi:hypothetical protein